MEITELQHQTLRTVCDTVVPALERADDPDGFWARKATDVGVDLAFIEMLDGMPAENAEGLLMLLDALAEQGINDVSRLSAEQLMRNVCLASAEAAAGIAALQGLTLFLAYGIPDPQTGQNPNWKTFGYPGPISAPPQRPKTLQPIVPSGDALELEADVVVVGSGAGGGVIAGELATKGLKVCVLEMGGHFDESDFNQTELWAAQNLYWRGGPTPTADLNISIQAGSCVGGGTVVNWTNCLKTKPAVRKQWAEEFGLTDVDTAAFDEHLDAVWERLSVNDRCSDFNKIHQAMQRGAEKLGWSFATITRNWDESIYDAAQAGYMGFGDQSGAKQSTLLTYLVDAAEAGADLVSDVMVEKVLVEDGRAVGVTGTWTAPDLSRTATVTVRAPRVVVAAGALESPAILLRSGIGGPAAGKYLRLHPATGTLGDYGEDMQSWWGACQAALVDEFLDRGDGYGFLLEGAQYTTALGASALPWTGGEEHKAQLLSFRDCGTFVTLIRDHGSGSVTLDEHGQAVHWYPWEDPRDVEATYAGIEAQVRTHVAAGARRVIALAEGMPTWRVGDDLEAYIDRLKRIPVTAGGHKVFCAHQMGSCRMGRDPETSVADPRGELHDTPGVWIGDASAFPTPSGTNPMITIMALARRTAGFIAADAQAAVSPASEVAA